MLVLFRSVIDVLTIGKPGKSAFDVTVTSTNLASDPFSYLVLDNRDVQCPFQFVPVIVADQSLRISFNLIGRLIGIDEDRAARRVAPEQRPLRAFQPLNIRYVIGWNDGSPARALDIVDIGLHRWRDRKSVVTGKGVYVRVDLGGGGSLKKNKQRNTTKC